MPVTSSHHHSCRSCPYPITILTGPRLPCRAVPSPCDPSLDLPISPLSSDPALPLQAVTIPSFAGLACQPNRCQAHCLRAKPAVPVQSATLRASPILCCLAGPGRSWTSLYPTLLLIHSIPVGYAPNRSFPFLCCPSGSLPWRSSPRLAITILPLLSVPIRCCPHGAYALLSCPAKPCHSHPRLSSPTLSFTILTRVAYP